MSRACATLIIAAVITAALVTVVVFHDPQAGVVHHYLIAHLKERPVIL